MQESAPVTREVWCAQPDVNVEEHVMGSLDQLQHYLLQLLIQTMIFSSCCTTYRLDEDLPFDLAHQITYQYNYYANYTN